MYRYESYENTGLDWVPAIPKHWSLTRSKFIFRNKSIKNCPDEPLLSVTQKDGVVLRSESDLNVWNPTDDVSGYKLIEPSNFVISLRSFEGGLELSTVKGIVSPAYTVLEKTRQINDPYFRWLMKSHQFIIELNKHVTGIRQGKNIGWDDFSNIYLTVPPIEEQKLISRYLDKKTSQIDSLVEKIQKKIELLKEQRTSLINHYVTKGLDPNVEVKDSGIEWIGEIPKHWGLKKLKYVVQIQKDIVGELGHDVLSVTQGGLKIKDLSKNEGQMSMDYSKYQQVTVDQFVMNHMDLLTGYVDQSKYNGVTSPDYRVFSLVNPLILPDYLLRILQFGYMGKIFYRYGRGVSSMGRWRLPSDEFLDFSIPVPPVKEQENIVQQLGRKISYDYGLIDKELKRVELLKEYRQSLISSVVTGKVRVTEDMV